MARPKKVETVEIPIEVIANLPTTTKSEKERLLELYKTLKDLGVNSIGDLEVRISRL